jgi:hypothetical protein
MPLPTTSDTPPAHIPVEWLGGIVAALGALAYLVKLGRVLQRLDTLATEVESLTNSLKQDAELHRETATALAVLSTRVEHLEDAA